jgi:hypothetical protein
MTYQYAHNGVSSVFSGSPLPVLDGGSPCSAGAFWRGRVADFRVVQ